MVTKTFADNDGLVQDYAYWTFTDIFEENSQLTGTLITVLGCRQIHSIGKHTYILDTERL